ncbi:MAG: zinc ribbon domain-containing protein [Methanobacterium sp.]
MHCDNCGAMIDKDEEYCPNCGMQLFDLPPNPLKNKSHKSSASSNRENTVRYEKSSSIKKPIKQRYMEHSEPESPDYSDYDHDYEHEHPDNYKEEIPRVENNPQVENKKSSGSGIVNIVLFLFIALLLGFVVGLLVFSSPTILKIPGLNA